MYYTNDVRSCRPTSTLSEKIRQSQAISFSHHFISLLPFRNFLCPPVYWVISKGGLAYYNVGSTTSRGWCYWNNSKPGADFISFSSGFSTFVQYCRSNICYYLLLLLLLPHTLLYILQQYTSVMQVLLPLFLKSRPLYFGLYFNRSISHYFTGKLCWLTKYIQLTIPGD